MASKVIDRRQDELVNELLASAVSPMLARGVEPSRLASALDAVTWALRKSAIAGAAAQAGITVENLNAQNDC